jgi:hypothetical protein
MHGSQPPEVARSAEARPMSKRPDVGLVRPVREMSNENGDKVLHKEGYGMFTRWMAEGPPT